MSNANQETIAEIAADCAWCERECGKDINNNTKGN